MLIELAMLTFLTSILSGIIGMGGGMILMAGMVLIFPVTQAMILHGTVQGVSNITRIYLHWKDISWRSSRSFLLGAALIMALLAGVQLRVSENWVMLALGILPWASGTNNQHIKISLTNPWWSFVGGTVITIVHLLFGVSGPLLDILFAHSNLQKKQVMGTKAMLQAVSHGMKILFYWKASTLDTQNLWYFTAAGVTAAACGVFIGDRINRLLSEERFRAWSFIALKAVGAIFIVKGGYGLLH